MPWRSIVIGGVAGAELINALEASCVLSPFAANVLYQRAFPTLRASQSVSLIILRPADLGFPGGALYGDMLHKPTLVKWSRANLSGQIIETCPAEVGPHLRLQYPDQPRGEVLWIVMQGAHDADYLERLFCVSSSWALFGRRRRMLQAFRSRPDALCEATSKYVYRVREEPDGTGAT